MKEKQVILSYTEHEEMLQRIEDLEKVKLCILNLETTSYTYGSIGTSSMSYEIDSIEDLEKTIKEIIENNKHYIEQPWKDSQNKLLDENNRLRLELSKYVNKKRYQFWK